jgi:hypothetical protein
MSWRTKWGLAERPMVLNYNTRNYWTIFLCRLVNEARAAESADVPSANALSPRRILSVSTATKAQRAARKKRLLPRVSV